MSSPALSAALGRYTAEFAELPGFFMRESMLLWDFILWAQDRLHIGGDFLEIGVYRGKSGALGAQYLKAAEVAVFVDIYLPAETREALRRARRGNIVFLERRSADLLTDAALHDKGAQFRWCHIDGDHTGYSTAQDLVSSAALVGERGIICVDDFFSFRYPQLTAAVYDFLAANRLRFRMLLCGANKCYICRAPAYAAYEKDIKENLPQYLRAHQTDYQVYKTSYSFDDGCYSIGAGYLDRPIYGLDENPDIIPA
jgi:predicted O-methyltransferase YrrM